MESVVPDSLWYNRRAMRYTCPCCGYKTLPQEPPGTYALCPICDWEDDGVQFEDPDYEGGANFYSLRHEQKRFLSRGEPTGYSRSAGRDVTAEDVKDPDWRPLPQAE